ncbi:activated RNA polymerase II transcriptional coactivator p15 [Vespa velutina]|uniref:activated RNA polymerase II transcriptional coactivator p15 n=1 Tax=Vespa velutina TaxID=202808 RepID=UPI001FB25265|nr:activated RNA polymerase II transcriptional coactivator p15 [Vespa velutina]XP_047360405.1 activated RNA polymerase II transcriptional coactivator p15 [Vespa velutina]XP_047360492.1 activated RNA polymerase II transcriptional coactivator p15 [Vespa velutina]
MPKSKEYVSSDSESDSEQEEQVKKKQKIEKEEKAVASKKPKKEVKESKDEDETVWDLGNNRQVNVRDFKGKLFVDIREMYYDKAGDLKPGKKGICLNMTQWRKFMSIVEEVDRVAKSKC